jgi:multidrug efflux system membrane fusion protein
VIKPDGTVEDRPVKVAQLGARNAVIESGLQANEQVVIGGQSRLQPGSPTTILHGQAAQALLSQAAQQAVIP